MQPPEEMKKRVTGDIRTLNRRLLPLAVQMDKKLRAHNFAKSPPGRIVSSMFRKAVRTFRAIELLKRDGLIEEAWILLRVLLEVHVNITYFLRQDAVDISHRYLDASILQKLTHLREVNFYEGTDVGRILSINREEWERLESEIKERYSASDFKAIRKHGFSGKSFLERAKDVKLETMYEYCYRIASRSVHSFDPAETSLMHGAYKKHEQHLRLGLLKSRRLQLERNQNMLLGRLAWLFAQIIKDPLVEMQLLIIGVGYEKFCGPSDEPAEDDTGSFRVWRV